MSTYKAVTRPALEYASSIWSPLVSSTSINQLQVMQNAALRTATGCTQDTNIHHYARRNAHTSYIRAPTAPRLTIQTRNTTSITALTQTYNILQHSKANKTIFNNGRYTTNIPTEPHTITTTDITTNMRHIHTSFVSRYLATRGITKYSAYVHHTLADLNRYFSTSLVALLPNSEQINHPSSNHTYTESTPNHIHHHYAPSVTLTHMIHIIYTTAPTYAPRWYPWNRGQTPLE